MGWPDLCLLETLEPICHRIKKVRSRPHISEKGGRPPPPCLPGGRLEFIELTDANYPKRM